MINEIQAKKYCSEDIALIENYDKAIADITQTWEIHHRRGISENKTKKQLKDENLYDKRPANELIFLTSVEHRHLHTRSNKTKQKISAAMLGNTNSLGKHYSEVTKQKMRKPKSAEHKQKIGEAKCGTHWWNNGVINKRSKECPGPEWKCGMIIKPSTAQQ